MATQAITETPDWTLDEIVMCTKIMREVEEGKIKIHTLR